MIDDRIFSIKQTSEYVKFENHSDYNLIIYSKPIKPKRKYIAQTLIAPKSFVVIEAIYFPIDLTKVIFSLEQV